MPRPKRSPAKPKPKTMYEVTRFFTFPADSTVIERIQSGDHVPYEDREKTRIEAGTIIDLNSLPDLVRANVLEREIVIPLTDEEASDDG